ncbi:MAG: SusC/RagA family TonB-linked outer membrane protein, partial [Mucilaginibacter polytrichastri]|nr:SusC/RagA family TonB-linked outer membrane protein [Mucilaginibacter polytrichastri]
MRITFTCTRFPLSWRQALILASALLFITAIPQHALAKNYRKRSTYAHHDFAAIDVSGVVKDAKGTPLAGVTITVKGTQTRTASDESGRFALKNLNANAVLVFTYVGFKNREIAVGNQSNVNVTLEEVASTLNEVVVVGYGTQSKKDVTGAVAQVKAEQLEKENPATVQDVLRGNAPGLNISQTNSASAKGGGDLQIRGQSTISAGGSPLLVVDGVIYPGALSDINPNDIATVDVLKDASSAAVYGAKSASGVIIVTTKRGSSEKPVITFNTNAGFGELAKNQPLYDGPGFTAFRTDVQNSRNVNHRPYQFNDPRTLPSNITVQQWLAYDNSSGDPVTAWLNRLEFKPIEIANYNAGKTTDWYSMMFQKGFRQDHTVSLSARNEQVNYYMSVGYTGNDGVIVGDNFKTLRTRLNLEGKAASFLTAGINLQYADRNESQVPVNWPQMVNASPYGSVYNDNGTLRDSPNDDLGNNANPFADNYFTDRFQKYNTLFGSLYVKGALPFGFSYQSNFTPNFEFYRYFNAVSANHPTYRARKGIATRTTQTSYNWQIDNILRWDKTFGVHTFNVTLLANAEKFQSWRQQMDNEGFDPNDKLSYHNIGSGIKPIISSDDQVSTGDALMARLNYSLFDRYLVTASIRRDGYSAFGQKNPRAQFPALALGWIFSQESFMKSM